MKFSDVDFSKPIRQNAEYYQLCNDLVNQIQDAYDRKFHLVKLQKFEDASTERERENELLMQLKQLVNAIPLNKLTNSGKAVQQ